MNKKIINYTTISTIIYMVISFIIYIIIFKMTGRAEDFMPYYFGGCLGYTISDFFFNFQKYKNLKK